MANLSRYTPTLMPSLLEPEGFNAVIRRFLGENLLEPKAMPLAWMPACELTEDKDRLVLVAELPGVKPEDVHVSVEGEVLTLRGEKSVERTREAEKYHLYERDYGTFTRSFVLPRPIDAAKVEAEWADGVLTVTMPKTTAAKGRVVDVAVRK